MGPYIINRLLRKFEQPFTDYLIQKNTRLAEKSQDLNAKLTFTEILKVQLLNLIPDLLFGSLTKNFSQLHLALFFVWGRYYELAKRVTRIVYKYEKGLEGQHGINYLRPGRIIMFTIVVQLAIFLFKVIKATRTSYQIYKKDKAQKERKRL
jgi:Pex2 / Pex12 amino terminal region